MPTELPKKMILLLIRCLKIRNMELGLMARWSVH